MNVVVIGPKEPRNPYVEFVRTCGLDAQAIPGDFDDVLPKADAVVVVMEETPFELQARAREAYENQRRTPTFLASRSVESIRKPFLNHLFGRHRKALGQLPKSRLAWFALAHFWRSGERFTVSALQARLALLTENPPEPTRLHQSLQALRKQGVLTGGNGGHYCFEGLTTDAYNYLRGRGLPVSPDRRLPARPLRSEPPPASAEVSEPAPAFSSEVAAALDRALALHGNLVRLAPVVRRLPPAALDRFAALVELLLLNETTAATALPETPQAGEESVLSALRCDMSFKKACATFERALLEATLARHGNDAARAARALQMPGRSFAAKRKSLGAVSPKRKPNR